MENNKSKFKEFLLSGTGKIAMIAVLCLVIWGIAIALIGTGSTIFMLIFSVLFIYFGWQALYKITPNVFIIMPIVGWIFYYLIKGILSLFIGVIVAPFQISKKITAKIQEGISQ